MRLEEQTSGKIVRKGHTWVPDGDVHFDRMAKKGYYQRHQLLMALAFVYRWDVAVDVGAHVGFMAGDMLRFFRNVVCFEPHPVNFKCLKKNLPRATIFPYALGAESKMISMDSPAIENSGAWEVVPGEHVQQHALDSFTFPSIGFLKIDVQGAELDVLRGAEKTLKKHKPTCMVECYQNKEPNREIETFMRSVGARSVLRCKSDVVFIFEEVNNLNINVEFL